MTTILCDFNFIAFSEFAMFSNYGKTKNSLKRERDQAAFIQGLTSRLFHIINQLPKGRVVCCIDSRSWRKDFMEKYKEKREDEEGNKGIMDNDTKQIFYNIIAELGEVMTKVGIHVSKLPGAEGDDLLFKWANHLNSKGENCIVISGDRDLTQIVKGPESPWTVVWDNKSNQNKMFAVSGWADEIEKPQNNTIFEFNPVDDTNTITKILRDANLNVMDTSYYILHKILIGDDGDDVPSSWKVYKGDGKYVRVTDKKAEKIIDIITAPNSDHSLSCSEWLDMILFNIDKTKTPIFSDHEQRLDELSGTLLRVMGDVDDEKLRKQVSENIIRNAKLVWLRDEMLPFNINQTINEHIEDSIENITGMNRAKWNKTALLEGTRFGKMKIAPSGFDPFSLVNLPDED